MKKGRKKGGKKEGGKREGGGWDRRKKVIE
jgi:hypothetical protein